MIRSLKSAVAALLLLVLSTVAAHATASGAIVCTGVSANFQAITCPDINEEFANANNRGIINLGTVAGTNTITANAIPFALTAYVDGQNFQIKPVANNTGAATLSVNGVGAKAFVSAAGVALAPGELQSSTIYLVRYYGATDQFRVISGGGGGGGGTGDVVGPASAVASEIALFDGTSGKLIKSATGSGLVTSTSGVYGTASTSAALAAVISDETGSGALVFGTSPTLTTPALGTPSSLVLTNATGLPVGSLTGLGAGVGTFLATPSSANLRAAITDEVGTGALMFGLISTMADDLSCTGSQVVRRNAGDTAFECATLSGTGDLLASNNLSDVANAATAFANIKQDATTTATGVAELATDAEAQAKTDTARVITPSNLAALGSSTTFVGLVELATTAEAAAQTDTARAVTPQGLAFKPESICLSLSDMTTDITAGTNKAYLRMPYAFTLTAVRLQLMTAATGGTLFTVDINETGSSILSTKLTTDASEDTSVTAATPAVISDNALADNAKVTFDVDAIGSTTAGRGAQVCMIGHQ